MEQQKFIGKQELNEKFIEACKTGDLTLIQYLLTSPDLVIHADIHTNSDYGFSVACAKGHLNLVKYLLTSPELTEHSEINGAFSLGFTNACMNQHFEIIKYLLTSPELKEHADIHAANDNGFKWGCVKEDLEIVRYFIFDRNIEQTIDIKEWLEDNKNESRTKEIVRLFELRTLNATLDEGLNNKLNRNSSVNNSSPLTQTAKHKI